MLVLLCLLPLALEGSEISEEVAEFSGRLWGMTGLLEVADTLWEVSSGDTVSRGARTRRMKCSLSFGR